MSELAAIPQPNDRPRKSRVVRYDPNDQLEKLGPQAVKDVALLGYALGNAERAEAILAEYPKEQLGGHESRAGVQAGRVAPSRQDPNRRLRVHAPRLAQGLGRPARHLGPRRCPVLRPGHQRPTARALQDAVPERSQSDRPRGAHVDRQLVVCHRPPPRSVPLGRPVPRRIGDLGPQPPLRRRVPLPG